MKREKISDLLLFVIIFLVLLSIILLKPISSLDELWNYNFASNISDGLIPYKDFNMVITPLLSFLCGIVLKVTFNELIVMRVLAAILCATILFVTYKLFCNINIKKEIAIIFIFFVGYLFADLFCIDYNFATLLLVLLTIYNEIKHYKEDDILIKANLKVDLFLGILSGLTITLKQTTGIFICVALLGNKLLFVRNKEELKIYFKSFVYRLIGIIIPVLVMIIYLFANKAFADFISYTIKGVSGFSNYVSYRNLINWNVLGVLSILVPITFIYLWIKTIVLEKDKILYIFLVYGLAMFVVCFPISDEIHFLIGALPTLVIILYELNKLLGKVCSKILKNEYINNLIIVFFSTFVVLFSISYLITNFYMYIQDINKVTELKHFKGILASNDFENEVKKIGDFIEENENVIILDATASVYMIPLDRYNKNYDMFNKGNFGFNGEDKIIKEISKAKNTKYLILNDKFNKNWQTPLDIIEFVKKNKTKSGEIEIFDIYE